MTDQDKKNDEAANLPDLGDHWRSEDRIAHERLEMLSAVAMAGILASNSQLSCEVVAKSALRHAKALVKELSEEAAKE
jgi:hypothetical protein